jgi:hypothetical protein
MAWTRADRHPPAAPDQVVTTEDARNLAIVAVIAIAPLALVILFAILRGYTIDLHMSRDDPPRRRNPE